MKGLLAMTRTYCTAQEKSGCGLTLDHASSLWRSGESADLRMHVPGRFVLIFASTLYRTSHSFQYGSEVLNVLILMPVLQGPISEVSLHTGAQLLSGHAICALHFSPH